MSIQTAIENAQTKVANAYTAVSNKGGTLPSTQNLSNLPSAISAIPTGTSPTLATLTVTPSTTAQSITPPSGTDGYNTVTVSAVTSSIDSDIVAGNIKSGVNILGVTGTVTELAGTTTTITSNGTYTPTSPSNGFTSVSVNVAGTTPTGTYTITANGTYDVTNYASADVSVAGGSATLYHFVNNSGCVYSPTLTFQRGDIVYKQKKANFIWAWHPVTISGFDNSAMTVSVEGSSYQRGNASLDITL